MDAIIKIKQIPDTYAISTGLDKYNRSRMPYCKDIFQAAQGFDGRYVTGLDEDAYEINRLQDDEEKEAQKKEILDLRTRLEKRLGKDLSATSDFWETFFIEISTDQDLLLSMDNPLHVIMFKVLVANGLAAPNLNETGSPKYTNAKYYCFTEARFEKEKVSTQKLRDKARSALSGMEDDKERMTLLGLYLIGGKFKKGMSTDALYNMLSEFIDEKKAPENVTAFIAATKKNVEDLQYKVTIDKAIKSKVIKFKEGQYYRGGVNLGKSLPEVMETLKSPEYANEFIQIHEEVV